MSLVILLGAPTFGVLIFEIILSGSALFNHANISLPKAIQPIIRGLLVTPKMHRIHHSTLADEHNSNYGFFLSCWGRLFHSYTHRASANDQTMPIGLVIMRESKDKRIDRILMLPFLRS
jgi:sterol desaturase/sphingolipid hydroxylase (fatty acid hydroxylase superfamily)